MKKIILFAILGLLLPVAGFSQFNVSFEGNGQYYDNNTDFSAASSPADSTKRFRSNAYLKLDYAIKNWDFGVQVESYLPKALLNFAPELDGINVGTLHARYKNTAWGLDVTGGHLYEQFGSGLIFRSWEDRQLGINNSILGGRIIYTPVNGLALTVLAGKQRIGMGFDLSDGTVYGANLKASLAELFAFDDKFNLDAGFSFVGRYETADTTVASIAPNAPDMVNAYSARLNFSKSGFYIGGEFVYKGEDVDVQTMGQANPNLYSGQALLVNMGYTQKGLGIDINLRRLENMGFYSQRSLAGNEFNTGVMNYLPALTKQYDYSLQNIYLYQAQPYLDFLNNKAGEIGGQMDFIYEFKKGSFLGGKYGTNVAINASYWGALDATINPDGQTYTSEFFGFGDKLYSDVGVEIRKRCNKQWSFILMYLNQYYNQVITGHKAIDYANTVSGEATFKFCKTQSIKLELQHQWTTEKATVSYRQPDGGYVTVDVQDPTNWWAVGLEYTLNYHWSVFVNDMYNYLNDTEDKSNAKKHFYNAGITFITGATRISASYGQQRGGLLCVGGVCRMVPESSGLTLNITTSF